ncbi:protein of unknown function [Cupriavidus neocaledonicus]|uniref:Uncharacterized protein n=1 Tax=Cupriavidus neocaledonicus TaxID=1040979 RepID=A0A375H2E1_9BURK|nr:protein of unknown function [Cupriavidus neocaledonicus]
MVGTAACVEDGLAVRESGPDMKAPGEGERMKGTQSQRIGRQSQKFRDDANHGWKIKRSLVP